MNIISRMSTVPVRLRPMDLSDFLDELIKVYRERFRPLSALALVLSLPGIFATLLVGARLVQLAGAGRTVASPAADQALLANMLPSLVAAALVALLACPLLYGGLVRAAIDAVTGRPFSFSSVVVATLRRYVVIWALALLAGIPLLLLTLTCLGIPLAVWLGVRWSLAGVLVFAEELGPLAALGRSWSLTRNAFWRTFGLVLLVSLAVSIANTGLAYVGQLAAVAFTGVAGVFASLLVAAVLQSITSPITFLALALIYLDRQARTPGLGLERPVGS